MPFHLVHEMEDDWSEAFDEDSLSRQVQEAPLSVPTLPTPSAPSIKASKAKITRPVGSWGSSVLKQALSSVKVGPEPGSAAYARQCKEKKKKDNEVALSRCPPTDLVPASSMTLWQKHGAAEVMYVGNSIHNDLVDAISSCQTTNLLGRDDDLVQHALEGALTTVSTKSLSKSLGQTSSVIGARMLSIGSCLFLLAGSSVKIVFCFCGVLSPRP